MVLSKTRQRKPPGAKASLLACGFWGDVFKLQHSYANIPHVGRANSQLDLTDPNDES